MTNLFHLKFVQSQVKTKFIIEQARNELPQKVTEW